jgi:hypothetical protein
MRAHRAAFWAPRSARPPAATSTEKTPSQIQELAPPPEPAGAGPSPAGTAVGRAVLPDPEESEPPDTDPLEVFDGEGVTVGVGVAVAVGVTVGLGVAVGAGVCVAALTIDRTVESTLVAAVSLLLTASTVKLLPAGVPAAT